MNIQDTINELGVSKKLNFLRILGQRVKCGKIDLQKKLELATKKK